MAEVAADRRAWIRAVVSVVVLVVGLVGVVLAVEGDKEVWALCGNVRPGDERDPIMAMLATAAHLRIREETGGGGSTVSFETPYTLGASACTVSFVGGAAVSREYREAVRLRSVAAAVAIPLLALLLTLQVLLAAGRPLGARAWGGRYDRLPGPLRVASAASAGVVAAGGVVAAERAGWVQWLGHPGVVEVGVALLGLLFMVSLVGNALSSSARERRLGIPVALLLALAFVTLTLAR